MLNIGQRVLISRLGVVGTISRIEVERTHEPHATAYRTYVNKEPTIHYTVMYFDENKIEYIEVQCLARDIVVQPELFNEDNSAFTAWLEKRND